MSQCVAFLRAINVGGRTVKMDTLRALFESLKLKQVETFIASGNLIFAATSGSHARLEAKIAAKLHSALGYEVATFIRTGQELAQLVLRRPFRPADLAAAQTFNVALLHEPPSAAAVKNLFALRSEFDNFAIHEREVYWLSRWKQSEAKFTNAVLERILGQPATMRGVHTLEKLVAKYEFT